MITLPCKAVPFICHDPLKVLLTALFVEVNDVRKICLADPTTNSKRIGIVRESSVFEDLINALDIFGEEDFIQIIRSKLIVFTDELSLGVDFKTSLEDNFNEIL